LTSDGRRVLGPLGDRTRNQVVMARFAAIAAEDSALRVEQNISIGTA
jgi:hypothetical protein